MKYWLIFFLILFSSTCQQPQLAKQLKAQEEKVETLETKMNITIARLDSIINRFDTLRIRLNLAFGEVSRKPAIAKKQECYSCGGTGHCRICKGTGMIVSYYYSSGYQTKVCWACRGKGICKSCRGRGYR